MFGVKFNYMGAFRVAKDKQKDDFLYVWANPIKK